MNEEGHKGARLVLWFVLSTLAIAVVAFFTRKNLEFTVWESIKLGAICSVFVAIAVHVFEWHLGIDYIAKALYLPPLFILKILYTMGGYLYDLLRKIFDRRYIIVTRPLGWGKDAELRRLERLQAKVHRIRSETEVLDEIHGLRMARGRHENIDLDLERQLLETEHELEMVRYRRLYGDEPTEEQIKIEMLNEQLNHQRRMSQLELEHAHQSRSSAQRQLPGPKDDDDDDVVF